MTVGGERRSGDVGVVIGRCRSCSCRRSLVTCTSTVPVPAGAVAVIVVALSTVNVVAAAGPKFTAVAPAKFVPVTVTVVPPVSGPEAGLTPVTVGRGRWRRRSGDRT